MNLLQIRTKFRDLSGRYDLVNDDFSDNGSDFFINEGGKWLDRTIETQKSWASFMAILNAGAWYVQFPNARAIKEVWITTTEGKWQLEKKRLQDMMAAFFTQVPADWTNGTPEYYSPAITRYIPEDVTPATLATFAAFVGIITPATHDFNAIILSAPVDQNTLVEIIGLFYSILLTADDDENYWSTVHPLLLIQAAIRQTYIVGGNKPLLDILNQGIVDDLGRIDKDLTEQMIAEIDEMEG